MCDPPRLSSFVPPIDHLPLFGDRATLRSLYAHRPALALMCAPLSMCTTNEERRTVIRCSRKRCVPRVPRVPFTAVICGHWRHITQHRKTATQSRCVGRYRGKTHSFRDGKHDVNSSSAWFWANNNTRHFPRGACVCARVHSAHCVRGMQTRCFAFVPLFECDSMVCVRLYQVTLQLVGWRCFAAMLASN